MYVHFKIKKTFKNKAYNQKSTFYENKYYYSRRMGPHINPKYTALYEVQNVRCFTIYVTYDNGCSGLDTNSGPGTRDHQILVRDTSFTLDFALILIGRVSCGHQSVDVSVKPWCLTQIRYMYFTICMTHIMCLIIKS